MRQINTTGLTLVKRFEGIEDGDPSTVNLDPYLDPVGIWTIGWGHALRDPLTGRYLRGRASEARARALYPVGLTMEQAEILLRADLIDAARDVIGLITAPLTDNQFAALTSFEFNTGGLATSTLRKKLNAGDYMGAAAQFGRWVKGHLPDGRVVQLAGLVTRRRLERELFETA